MFLKLMVTEIVFCFTSICLESSFWYQSHQSVKTKKKKKAINYFLQILIDGKDEMMPDGFPKFETQGSKKLFTFRIPKFNDTAVIDPTANVGGSEGGGEVSGGDTTAAPVPTTSRDPTGSASLLLFNLSALAFCLYVAAIFTM